MYLKALELQGFKSFPEKTRLSFEKDITVIVGPNGSGKSNLSDALLWVMGEQKTRMLRGGKMEDVIFGGTEKRGAMGFAQVTLVLDNTTRILPLDTDEVSIARRYYRSGESEYYINREQVRLRDVTELLMDTGLGCDGYSIIGQGRISEIVSAKSTDRREIFEEAAGIARFRHRKDESERKLARTEDNLLRIGSRSLKYRSNRCANSRKRRRSTLFCATSSASRRYRSGWRTSIGCTSSRSCCARTMSARSWSVRRHARSRTVCMPRVSALPCACAKWT